MRMWMIAPVFLCRKHLLGEHNELHMLAGSILRVKSLEGFVRNGLLQVGDMAARHEALAQEMLSRGYNHHSPLPEVHEALQAYPPHIRHSVVDIAVSERDLRARCADCAARMDALGIGPATEKGTRDDTR